VTGDANRGARLRTATGSPPANGEGAEG